VDLFSGAGGLSLGAEQAGFDVLAAMEYDPVHAAAHAYNFPKTAVVCRDARKVSGEDIREAATEGWRLHRRRGAWDGKLDAVFGGPPCQGFSVGGLGERDDERNRLVFDFARLVGELRPRYFVMENVPGMQGAQGEDGPLLDELREALKAAGYAVADPWVLNACFAGVPQDRRRLFLAGARRRRSGRSPNGRAPGPGRGSRATRGPTPPSRRGRASSTRSAICRTRPGTTSY
jgi:DNA (cytosine-5)-methyltransferase 1